MQQRCGKNQEEPPRARHLFGAPPLLLPQEGGRLLRGPQHHMLLLPLPLLLLLPLPLLRLLRLPLQLLLQQV